MLEDCKYLYVSTTSFHKNFMRLDVSSDNQQDWEAVETKNHTIFDEYIPNFAETENSLPVFTFGFWNYPHGKGKVRTQIDSNSDFFVLTNELIIITQQFVD